MNASIIKGGKLGAKTGCQTDSAGCLISCLGCQKCQKQDQTLSDPLSPYSFLTTVIKAVVKVCGLFRHFHHPGVCGHRQPCDGGLGFLGRKTTRRLNAAFLVRRQWLETLPTDGRQPQTSTTSTTIAWGEHAI
jgi:hypothetical protein